MESNVKRIIAVMSVLVMVSVAVIPAADASTGAELESPVVYEDDPEYGAIFVALWLVIGLVATAAAIGYTAGSLGEATNDTDNAGDQEAINQAFREVESGKITFAADTAKNIITTILPADAELWFFTSDYWQKMIEYVVCDMWYQDNPGYDEVMNDAMVGSGLPVNAANYMYTWSAAIDNSYNNLFDYFVSELATKNYGEGMEFSLDYGSGSFTMDSSVKSDNAIVMDMTQIAKPNSAGTCVYIDTESRDFDDESYCHTIYVFGDSGATLTFMGPSGTTPEGTTYTLNRGANDIDSLNMPSGVYSLETGHTYAGNIIPLSTNNAANIYGGMVINQGDSLNYFIPTANEMSVALYNAYDNIVANNITSITLNVDYNGPDGDDTVSSVILGTDNQTAYDIIGMYDDLVQQITRVAYNAHIAGEAAWEIFDIAEESSQYIKPSSIVPNIPNVEMTSADLAGTYIAAMKQILEYGQDNMDDFDGWVTNIENVGLYVYGNVIRDGKVWAENVVFTPYSLTSDQRLQIGTNTWNGSGFGMVWAQVEDYGQWDGQASASQYVVMDLEPGDIIEIEGMYKQGEPITEIELNRAEIQKWNSGRDEGDGVDDDEIAVLNAQIMMLFIIVELGLIIILIGAVTGMSFLSIIGVVVMIVGVLWPQVFTSLFLGDFVWDDLIPLSWI